MSSSHPAHNHPILDIQKPSSSPVASAATSATTPSASNPSPPTPMGNTTSTSAPSNTNNSSIPHPTRQPGDKAIPKPSRSMQMHRAPQSIIDKHTTTTTANATAPSTATVKTSTIEIIDLCSDSDDEDAGAPPPPRKRVKLAIETGMARLGDGVGIGGDGREKTGTGRAAETRAGKEGKVCTGWTWETSAAFPTQGKREGEGVQDIKDEGPTPQPTGGPIIQTSKSPGRRTGSQPGGVDGVVRPGVQPPRIANARDDDEKKNFFNANTLIAPTSAPSSHDIIIEIKNPNAFTTSHVVAGSDDTNPAVARNEMIQTKNGWKKRKMVGPFVLDDHDDVDGDAIMRSAEDEGCVSVSYKLGKADSSNWGKISGPGPGSGSGYGPSSLDLRDQVPEKTRVGEMELYQRRRQSEDKCAETSRRMRKEALAKREAELKKVEEIDLSKHSLQKEGLCSPKRRGSKRNGFGNDDDLFGDENLSPEDIEAQIDLAQAFANDNGILSSPKDMSRSCQPSTSAFDTEKADRLVESGSQRNARNCPPQDSILRPEKQLLDGGVGETVVFGNDHFDQEQAEKYWRKMNKEDRRKGKWPEKREIERGQGSIVPSPKVLCALSKVIDGARGKDEARLLAAKEPLRAAPNVNGVLAQLVKKAGEKDATAAKVRESRDLSREPQDAHSPVSPVHSRQYENENVDESLWTKDGSLRERKRDIENLMSAFTETAECWCVAFDALSERYKSHAESELQQLKDFAHPILQGYSFRNKGEKKITHIKSNMARRVQKHQELNRSDSNPSQHEIDLTLVGLMGQKRVQRGKELLKKVLVEYEEYKANPKNRSHLKRPSFKPSINGAARSKPTTPLTIPCEEMGELRSTTEEASPCGGPKLNRKQQVAWQREEARYQKTKQAYARYEKVLEPLQQTESTKKVRFADACLWDNGFDHAQISESEESDEDEDETAPSFGRGENHINSGAPPNVDSGRKNVSGKGLWSHLRKVNEKAATLSPTPTDGPTAKKRLPTQSGTMQPMEERENHAPQTRREMGGKSVPIITQREAQRQLTTQIESFDTEESQGDAEELESEAEDSLGDEADVIDGYDDMNVLQYDIVVDYENFDDFQDANSVPLGRHIDAEAAFRQMSRVITDIVAWAGRKYRNTRTIWDVEDLELVTQTIILPTGGECRIRKGKSWAPAASWPGKQRARAVAAPKVFYLVHEAKTTSLRPPAASGEDADDERLFGPEDFEDPQAVVERERDWYFTSRHQANELARDRLIAFNNRHGGTEEVEGAESTTELAEYMEQIKHDKVCFEQEKRFWIETDEGRKGKVEIKIRVEELIADMPHI